MASFAFNGSGAGLDISVYEKRFRFRIRKQYPGENYMQYLAVLKRLAQDCSFGRHLEEQVRDQFLYGVRCNYVRYRLFSEENPLTCENMLEICTMMAALNAKGDESSGPSRMEEEDPFLLITRGFCQACGAHGHEARACRFRLSSCKKCKRSGHVHRACPRPRPIIKMRR